MSDYTPTTEEVPLPPLDEEVIKQLALLGLDQMVVDVDDAKAEQFLAHVDRWLAEVKAQERKAERERTIKLLEDTPATRTTWIDDGISVYALDKDDFIALIKGEEQ